MEEVKKKRKKPSEPRVAVKSKRVGSSKGCDYDNGKKQMATSEDIGEMSDEMEFGEVLDTGDMSEYPQIRNLKPRDQMILCASVSGYSPQFIAESLKTDRKTISRALVRIDPTNAFKISKDKKRAFLQRVSESKMLEAMSNITPGKLKESSARELSAIAKDFATISGNLTTSKHRETGTTSRLESLLLAVEIERLETAEVIEEQNG